MPFHADLGDDQDAVVSTTSGPGQGQHHRIRLGHGSGQHTITRQGRQETTRPTTPTAKGPGDNHRDPRTRSISAIPGRTVGMAHERQRHGFTPATGPARQGHELPYRRVPGLNAAALSGSRSPPRSAATTPRTELVHRSRHSASRSDLKSIRKFPNPFTSTNRWRAVVGADGRPSIGIAIDRINRNISVGSPLPRPPADFPGKPPRNPTGLGPSRFASPNVDEISRGPLASCQVSCSLKSSDATAHLGRGRPDLTPRTRSSESARQASPAMSVPRHPSGMIPPQLPTRDRNPSNRERFRGRFATEACSTMQPEIPDRDPHRRAWQGTSERPGPFSGKFPAGSGRR